MPVDWMLKSLFGAAVGFGLREGRNALSSNSRESRTVSHVPTQTTTYHFHENKNVELNEKDLNSCQSFCIEGIEMLQTSFDRMARSSTSVGHEASAGQVDSLDMAGSRGQGLTGNTDVLASITRELFSADIDKLKSISKESFAWAKSCFKEAREDATRAFNNEALNVDQRLLAAKVRIVSAILGGLDEPETAAVACRVYLKELNGLSCSLQQFQDFSRKFAHLKRLQRMTSVVHTNQIVFQFTEILAKDVLNVHNWPRLSVSGVLCFHPIRSLGLLEITNKATEQKYDMEPETISVKEFSDPTGIAVNKAGELVIAGLDCLSVYSVSGELRFTISQTDEELKGAGFRPCAVFTDEWDNIYVYSTTPPSGCQGEEKDDEEAVVFLFNKEGHLQHVVSVRRGFMAVEKKTGKIFISSKNGVYIYESYGELVHSFSTPVPLLGSKCPIALCEEMRPEDIIILLADIHYPNVCLLANTGTEFFRFQAGQAGGWKYIVFNPISKEIVVSYLSKELTHFKLESYFKSGKFLGTIDLPDGYLSHPRAMTVTPSGRIAILYENVVHLI